MIVRQTVMHIVMNGVYAIHPEQALIGTAPHVARSILKNYVHLDRLIPLQEAIMLEQRNLCEADTRGKSDKENDDPLSHKGRSMYGHHCVDSDLYLGCDLLIDDAGN